MKMGWLHLVGTMVLSGKALNTCCVIFGTDQMCCYRITQFDVWTLANARIINAYAPFKEICILGFGTGGVAIAFKKRLLPFSLDPWRVKLVCLQCHSTKPDPGLSRAKQIRLLKCGRRIQRQRLKPIQSTSGHQKISSDSRSKAWLKCVMKQSLILFA